MADDVDALHQEQRLLWWLEVMPVVAMALLAFTTLGALVSPFNSYRYLTFSDFLRAVGTRVDESFALLQVFTEVEIMFMIRNHRFQVVAPTWVRGLVLLGSLQCARLMFFQMQTNASPRLVRLGRAFGIFAVLALIAAIILDIPPFALHHGVSFMFHALGLVLGVVLLFVEMLWRPFESRMHALLFICFILDFAVGALVSLRLVFDAHDDYPSDFFSHIPTNGEVVTVVLERVELLLRAVMGGLLFLMSMDTESGRPASSIGSALRSTTSTAGPLDGMPASNADFDGGSLDLPDAYSAVATAHPIRPSDGARRNAGGYLALSEA